MGRGECAGLLQRQRVDEGDLEDRGAGRGFGGVQVRNAGRDDAQVRLPRATPRFRTVEGALLAPCRDFGELRSQAAVGRTRVGRDHDPAAEVVLEMRRRGRRPCRPGGGVPAISGRHHRLRMADAGGHPVEDGQLPPLGHFDRREEEVVRLLAVRRLDHRQSGGNGVAAVVLLVLRGGHAGVVRGDHDQGAAHTGVGRGEQRIRGDVQSDVLHRHEDPGVGESGAQADFQGHLLVWRPLGPPAEGIECFEDFRRRCAGIAGAESHAGVQRGECDGFVAG